METKIVKEYKYSDLGIDIILKDIVLYKIGREWLPKIDIEKLSKNRGLIGQRPFPAMNFCLLEHIFK